MELKTILDIQAILRGLLFSIEKHDKEKVYEDVIEGYIKAIKESDGLLDSFKIDDSYYTAKESGGYLDPYSGISEQFYDKEKSCSKEYFLSKLKGAHDRLDMEIQFMHKSPGKNAIGF